MTDNSLIYAIGDVHGHAGLLNRVLDFVDDHAARHGGRPKVIFLGDIVDRGPENRRAMDLVHDALVAWPQSRLILGNHDSWLLEFFEQGVPDPTWLLNGGGETLDSYGLASSEPEVVRTIVAEAYTHHHAMLHNASIQETEGNYTFVHAGVDPSRPIPDQRPEDCIWIRGPFLNHQGPLSHIVVHGHTPMIDPPCPVITENRISMDTGAFATGVLSLMVLEPSTGVTSFHATNEEGRVQPIDPIRMDRGYGCAA